MYYLKYSLFLLTAFFFLGANGVVLYQDDLRMVCQSFQKTGEMNETMERLREELFGREISNQEYNRNLPIIEKIVAKITENPSKVAFLRAKPMNAGASTSSQGPTVSMGAQPGFKVEVFYPFVVSFLLAGGNSTIETAEKNGTKPAVGTGQPIVTPIENDKVEESEYPPIQENGDYNSIDEDEQEEAPRQELPENKPNSIFPGFNGKIDWGNPDNKPPSPAAFFNNIGQGWKPPNFNGNSVNNPSGRLGHLGPLLASFFSGLKTSCRKLRFPLSIETDDPKQISNLFNSLTEQKNEILASYVKHQIITNRNAKIQ